MPEWNNDFDETQMEPGWYAILYGWEPSVEGLIPGAALWDGEKWFENLPICAVSSAPFDTYELASTWADEEDPCL